jgi:hypothetical protein
MATRAKDIDGPILVKHYIAKYDRNERKKCELRYLLSKLERCPDSPEKLAAMERLNRQMKALNEWFFAYYEAESEQSTRKRLRERAN